MEAETCKSPSIYYVISHRRNAEKRSKNHTHTVGDPCKTTYCLLKPDIQVQYPLIVLVIVSIIGQK